MKIISQGKVSARIVKRNKNMAIVPLKCPKCGSTINLDDQQETSTCEYCKGPIR
ncbi:MAG: hypothetical protein WCG21_06385 [Eubacteriales bacterium]